MMTRNKFGNNAAIVCLLIVICLSVYQGCRAGIAVPTPDATESRSQAADEQPSAETKDTSAQPERVSLRTPDGVEIVGNFYQTSKPNAPAVLMLHQWGSNRHAFDGFARQLQAQGINALAIDGRGFGESTRRNNQLIEPSRSDDAVAGMKLDAQTAVNFLAKQSGVDPQRIGIVGASYGSSLAIIYAAQDPNIKAVALLSPGLNYFGNLPTEPAGRKFGERALLIVAAEDDPDSVASSRRLDSVVVGANHQLKVYARGGHGTGLFAARVGLDKLLTDFFSKNL